MSGKNAAEIAQLKSERDWYADRLQEEATKHTRTKEELKEARRKFENFLDSAGKTMYPCPECGRGMNSREGCLHCHVDRLKRALVRRANWQPIRTAPEKTPLLIYDKGASPPIAVAFYSDGWELEWGDGDALTPSHWMSLEDLIERP